MTIPILPEKPESSQTPETPFLSNKVSAPKVSASKPILLLVG